MTITELLIRVRTEPLDDPVRQWHDGMVVEARNPGVAVPVGEIQQFITDGTTPPGLANVSPVKRRKLRGFLRRARYLVRHTIEEISDVTGRGLDWSRSIKTEAERLRNDVISTGKLDTIWRMRELQLFCIIVADLDNDELSELLEGDWDFSASDGDVVNSQHQVRLRRLRIPYFNLAPPSLVARWRDPTKIVHVNRTAPPLTFAQVEIIP